MQCIKKGAIVFIADLKGGMDYSSAWDSKCYIMTDETAIQKRLLSLVEELERRKKLRMFQH